MSKETGLFSVYVAIFLVVLLTGVAVNAFILFASVLIVAAALVMSILKLMRTDDETH